MTKNKPELKPCPFKHKKQSLEVTNWSFAEYQVNCNICYAFGPYAKTEQWAVRKWNARSVNHETLSD